MLSYRSVLLPSKIVVLTLSRCASPIQQHKVVVSASTGLFGIGKNVLDVWCNTTFLVEDGENV